MAIVGRLRNFQQEKPQLVRRCSRLVFLTELKGIRMPNFQAQTSLLLKFLATILFFSASAEAAVCFDCDVMAGENGNWIAICRTDPFGLAHCQANGIARTTWGMSCGGYPTWLREPTKLARTEANWATGTGTSVTDWLIPGESLRTPMFDACEDANQISTSSSRHLPELVEAIRVNGDESTGCLTLRRPSGEQVQRCRGGPPGGPGLEASEWSFSVPDELLRSIALHEPEAAYLVAHLGRVSREERFIYLRPVLAKYVVPIPSKHYELVS
jgi:hypothetical protein